MPSTARLPARSHADEERQLRAARVAAMLDRWASEDVAGEPDWDVRQVQPLALAVPATKTRGTRRSRRTTP